MDRYVYDDILIKYLIEGKSDLLTARFFCEYDREKDVITLYDINGDIQKLSGPHNLIFWLVAALNHEGVNGEELDISGEGYITTRVSPIDVPECIRKHQTI